MQDFASARRQLIPLLVVLVAGIMLAGSAHAATVEYPLAGNVHPDQGTVQMWFRLDDEPGKSSSFRLNSFNWPGRMLPQISFSYSTYWQPDQMHLYLRMDGYLQGRQAEGGMFTSMEDVWKGDLSPRDYPRHARLHAGEWHYAAYTWKGSTMPLITVYLDGRIVVPESRPMAEPWVDLEKGRLQLPESRVTWDELKVSSTVLSPEEIAAAYQAGALANDESTLLLDHFDSLTDGRTAAAQIAGYHDETGGAVSGNGTGKIVEGKFGNALRLIN